MKKLLKSTILIIAILFGSCESIVDGINDNPNDILISDVDAELFLTGAMLANTIVQSGHLNRIGGMYSGQLVGLSSLYSNVYGYALSTAESNTTWSRIYVGVVPNARHIRNVAPNDRLSVGIAKVLEAHAVGTGASIFGDVPYSQINDSAISDPVFDSQMSVFTDLIALLDSAISDLNAASSRTFPQDIYYNGDANKWAEAANTLKARYYLQMKNYPMALTAANSGISSAGNSMLFTPRGDPGITGSKNLFWEILFGSRAGDIGTANSYLMQILDPANALYRGNANTDETARHGYSEVDDASGSANTGIVEEFEPMNLVTFAENQLIRAECAARASGVGAGLPHLNSVRAWLNGGGQLNGNFSGMPYSYLPYVAADFNAGGMENVDGIPATRAFLREVIEERYVSGFGMFIPYNDARRLRASDSDIAVPYFLDAGPAPPYPERMPYADDELNANENAPAEPGIFTKTQVNQ